MQETFIILVGAVGMILSYILGKQIGKNIEKERGIRAFHRTIQDLIGAYRNANISEGQLRTINENLRKTISNL